MSKYIDSEKLIAEIEKRMSENCELGKKAECFSHRAVEDNDILAIVESLQQEQPDAYEDAMLEVKGYVDKLYDNASIGLNEYDSGLYNGIAETCMKLRGFIKARTSMEQLEVDLEKLGGIARHLIAVKDHEEDMRLTDDEWLLLERIGYPERFNARKEE